MSARVAIAAAVGLAALACGAAAAPPRAAPGVLTETRTTVYFLTDGGRAPLGIRTTVRRSRGTFSRAALERLLRGPSRAERRRGLTTAIPRGTTVLAFRVVLGRRGSTAFVDLRGLPERRYDAIAVARIGTQIARTLIGVGDIERVRLRANGRLWGFLDHRGRLRDTAWDYDFMAGLDVGTARPGTEAVPGDSFSALP